MRGASTPSGGGAGKGAGEASAGLLSKTKAASAAQGGGAGLAVGLVGNWASSSTPPVAPVAAAPSLGNVCLSDPGSPSTSKKKPAATKSSKRAAHATESLDVVELASVSGQAPVEKTSIVVAARQEKAKKARVTGHTPPPRPDDQGKTRGCKRPFKGPGFGLRKGKPVSEQTVGGRKRFLGTFETEKDQKVCTAVCWRVYFPDVVLTEYEGYTAQDEEDWNDYLDAAAEMPTGVWSVAQEQGECRFDDYQSLLATAKKEVKAGTKRGIALCVAIGKVATLGLKHGNLIYPVPKGMAATPHMMAIAATVASLWAACRKLSREDIKKDALAAANAAIYAPETAKKACVAAMSALVSILLHVGKTFPAKQWPDHLFSSAVEGLGSTDAILLQMLRVAAQVCRAERTRARAATGGNGQHRHGQQRAATGSTGTGSNGRQQAAQVRAATGGNGQRRHGQQPAATGGTGTGSNGRHRHGQQRAATGSTGTGSNRQHRHKQQQAATGSTGTGSNKQQRAAQARAATGGNGQHRHGQQRAATGSTGTGSNRQQRAAQARAATGGNRQHRHGQQRAAHARAATGGNGQHRHGQQQAATGSTGTGSNGRQQAAQARAATGSNGQHRHGQQRAATGSTGTGSNGRQQAAQARAATGSTGTGSNGRQRAAQARAATGSNRRHRHRQQQAATGSTGTGSNRRQRAAQARAATGGNGQQRHGQQRAATGSTGTGSNK
ncbi:unnamed protein product [Closterium sp. NIES-64]|nr:unnamed protein product [Closterium sp. NIES-64]